MSIKSVASLPGLRSLYPYLPAFLLICAIAGVVLVLRNPAPPAAPPTSRAVERYIAGNEHATAKRFDEAIKAYREVLEMQPDFADAHFAVAMMYAQTGKHGDAVVSLEAFVKAKPESAHAWMALGNEIAAAQGDKQKAAEAYRKALEIDPNLEPAKAGLAAVTR